MQARNILLHSFLFFLFLFLSKGSDAVLGQDTRNFDLAKTEFTHAQTFYWYGRALDNSLYEFRQARNHLNTAMEHLSQITLVGDTLIDEIGLLEIEIQEFEKVLDAQEVICIENLNGRYPLSMDLMARNPYYELWDDAYELSLEDALSGVLQTPYPIRPLSEQFIHCILLLSESDPVLEEVAVQYILANSRTYVLSSYQLLENISGSELEQLMSEGPDSIISGKICQALKVNRFGIYSLNYKDHIEDLHYWYAEFQSYDKSGVPSNAVFSEGFCHDKTNARLRSTVIGVLLVFVLAISLFTFYFIRGRILREDSTVLGSVKVGLHAVGHFFGAQVLAIVEIVLLLLLVRSFAPESNEFVFGVKARLVWYLVIPVILAFVPLVTNYIVASRFLGKTLHKQSNLSGLIGGSLLAPVVYLTFHSVIKTGGVEAVHDLHIIISILFVVSNLTAYLYRSYVMKRSSLVLWSMLFFIPSVYLVIYRALLDVSALDLKWTEWLWILLPMFIGISLLLYNVWRLQFGKSRTDKKKYHPKKTIEDLNELKLFFENPETYVPISVFQDADCFEERMERILFQASEKVRIPVLYAGKGTGKTRMIQEMRNHFMGKEDIVVFYGDCDESQDSGFVPYEPFVQALGEYMGSGTFSNQSKKAANVLNILKDVDIGPVSSIAGFLGGADNQGDGADAGVVAQDMLLRFQKIQNAGKRILLVLEDIQWMDDTTERLLLELISQLCIHADNNRNLRILLTLRVPNGSDVEESHVLKQILEKGSGLLEIFDLVKNEQIDFSYSDYFERLLEVNGINMNYNSIRKLDHFFKSNNYHAPLHFNQILIAMIDKGWIQKEHDEYKLSGKANLDELLPPDELGKIYRQKFQLLDQDMLRLIIVAAYIGKTFEARILASVWWGPDQAETRILELLHSLQKAENLGIVIDVSELDDVYEFTSRGVMSELRAYDSTNTDNVLPQTVREYHKRIIAAMEVHKEKELKIDLNILSSVANRCRFLDNSKRNNLDRTLRYNLEAGNRCEKSGRLVESIEYYEYCLKLLSRLIKQGQGIDIEHQYNELVISLGQLYLDVSENEKALKLFASCILKETNQYAEQLTQKALALFRQRSDSAIVKVVLDEFASLSDALIAPVIRLRARFIMILSSNSIQNGKSEAIEALKVLLEDVEKETPSTELDALQGEVLNSLAGYFIRDNSSRCLPYLDKRLALILEIEENTFPLSVDRRKELYLAINYDRLDTHKKISLKFGTGSYARYYSCQPEVEEALFFIKEAIRINQVLGDNYGISNYRWLLGKHILKLDKPRYADAFKNLHESYWTGRFVGELWFLGDLVIEIEKANYFGELGKEIQLLKIQDDYYTLQLPKASFPDQSKLHILRHLKEIHPEFRKVLEGQFGNDAIESCLGLSGSKFRPEFGSFDSLIELFSSKDRRMIACQTRENRIEITFSMNPEKYPEGIGWDAVVERAKLSPIEQAAIMQKKRGSLKAPVLNSDKIQNSWDVNLVLEKKDGHFEIRTLFPGKMAPPLPDKRSQNDIEFRNSKSFWDENVFIE